MYDNNLLLLSLIFLTFITNCTPSKPIVITTWTFVNATVAGKYF